MVNRITFSIVFAVLASGFSLNSIGPAGFGVGSAAAQSCHASYQGVCIAPGSSDVDCAGGSGNGPRYARGPFNVVGPDQYGLDRDRDGIGCE